MSIVLFFIILAAFCGGSIPPFAKVALEVFQPFTLVMIRFFFGSLILLPFVIKKGELNISSFRKLSMVAAIGSLNPILLFIALQFTQASVAPLIYAAVPSMAAIYLALFKKQKIYIYQILGIIIGFVGVSLIILLPLLQTQGIEIQKFKGNVLIFGAAIAFLIYGLISKDKQKKYSISPMSLSFYFFLVTFFLSIPFAGYEILNNGLQLSQIKLIHVLSSLEIGIIGTSIFYLSYQYALKLSSELTAALFTYLQPVATIFIAIILLGEKISLPFIIGGLLAIAGAQLASSKKKLIKIRRS